MRSVQKYVCQMVLFGAWVTGALAQGTSTWRDTEGNIHSEEEPLLDMEHAKGDPRYRPIIAVARVFSLRFNMATAGKFSVQNEDLAKLGPYTIARFDVNHPCQFDLKLGDDKLAEINFDLLTAAVETGPTTGSSYHVIVFGKMGAVCWRGNASTQGGMMSRGSVGMFNNDGSDSELPKAPNCAAGIETLLPTPTEVFLLQDALAYIFDNHICEPATLERAK